MFDIPVDVQNYIRDHFAKCNKVLASNLATFPAIHEESLDMNLIAYWSSHQEPVKFKSNWTVRVDAHFIGGGRHWGTWEVADIGIMIIFRRRGKVVRSKLAFVQSKKLYANSLVPRKESAFASFGMGRLLVLEEEHNEIVKSRLYKFGESSRYEAFQKNNDQQSAMSAFQNRYGMKLYYLFYNPTEIPHEITVPIEVLPKFTTNTVGCRVIPKPLLDDALSTFEDNHTPSYGDLKYMLSGDHVNEAHLAGWRFEYFVTDLMMACKEGLIDDSENFQSVLNFLNDKRRPMSSSLAINIDMP